MAVLVNQYKKIQYLIDALVLPFLKTQHPQWRELILVYLKYLDDNPLFKAINFTDNANVNEMFSELLDEFLNIYFKDVVDLDKFGLNDDNKRLFIALSKLIHNLKATKTSFGFFFNSFTNFSIPTDTGDVNVNDLVVELLEKPEWWLLNNDPTRPYTYIFKINETDLTNLRELISEVHPSGFLQLFLYEVHFEEHFRGYDCLELTTRYGIYYNGKYNYDGIQMIDGVPEALLYQGEFVVEDFICPADESIGSPTPYYFSSQEDVVFDLISDIKREIQPASQADVVFSTQSDIELPVSCTGNLTFIDILDQGNTYYGVWTDGNFIYAARASSGFSTYSADGAGNLTYIDTDIQNIGGLQNVYRDIWGDGTFVYAACQNYGLRSHSVDGAGNITYIHRSDIGGEYYGVWGDGTFVYAAGSNAGLISHSIDGVGNITQIDNDYQSVFEGWYKGVWGDGNFIYCACTKGGIRSYSVDGAGNLTFIDSDYQAGGDYEDLWGDGNFIYVACKGGGLRTYSVDGAGNLTFESVIDDGGNYMGVWGNGNFIYAACDNSGIRSYSVDGAGNLTLIDTHYQTGAYNDVIGDSNFLYIGGGWAGVMSYSGCL